MTITIDELKQSPLYSEELGIALRENKEREYFKWFLASLLFRRADIRNYCPKHLPDIRALQSPKATEDSGRGLGFSR